MSDERLRNAMKVQRAIRDLTQAELAELAGVTRRSINAIETGQMVPSVLLALKIARALGVSVESVFTIAEPAESAESVEPPGSTRRE